ncbi:MAG: DUF3105 domain-containing protein [Dehalococcoidia bacterium]|nr:DUF3105 domain-containing protein [Dehalococcoidia bacterium]
MSKHKHQPARKNPPSPVKGKGREKGEKPTPKAGPGSGSGLPPGMHGEKGKKSTPKAGMPPWVFLVAGVVLVVLVVLGVVLLSSGPKEQATVRSIPIQGNQHVKPGDPHPAYNSNPPTSGWHYEDPAPWGVSESEIPDEQAIHNMEHGGIWLTYGPSLDSETVNKLRELVKSYRSKVLLTPRAKNDSKMALTAWGKLDTMDSFDEGRIRAFIGEFINQGPEKVPD